VYGGTEPGPMAERMQALLARAAEEQLSEQRQVSVVLAELRDLLVSLGKQVGERLGPVEARLDELGRRMEAMAQRTAAPLPPLPPPAADALAVALAERLGDRLVELAQREILSAVADTERRLAAHVDDAVLALAAVLLRRERAGRADGPATPDAGAPGEAPVASTDGDAPAS
jgi:hypothetical protein